MSRDVRPVTNTRAAATRAAATTSEDAPASRPTGLTRKRASITYASDASIAYLVKNFTSGKTRPFWPESAESTPLRMPR